MSGREIPVARRRGRPRKHVYKAETEYEKAMAREACPGGPHIMYLTCPVCFRNIPLSRASPDLDVKPDPQRYFPIQARHRVDERSSGGPYGFFVCPSHSLTISQAASDPEASPYLELLKQQLLSALKLFASQGLISRRDLEEALR